MSDELEFSRVEDQVNWTATELLGWYRDDDHNWLTVGGHHAAFKSWNPFYREEDAWRLFTFWEQAKQIHKSAGGVTVIIQMPNGDLVSFGHGTGRYCGPALYQAMAAAVGHYRIAHNDRKILERKRQYRSERYEDPR